MSWIPITERMPGVNQEVAMKWDFADEETAWKGNVLDEIKDIKPEFYHTLIWLDESTEPKGLQEIADELEKQNPFSRPEYNGMYAAGYSNAVARLRELINNKT